MMLLDRGRNAFGNEGVFLWRIMDTLLDFDSEGANVGKDSVTLRQGNHLADRILVKCENSGAYDSVMLEFELPKERKHRSFQLPLEGENYVYDIPSCVTRYSGLGELQLVLTKGDAVLRSEIVSVNIEPSIRAESRLDENDRNDFFSKMFEAIGRADSAADTALGIEGELRRKVESGEFNGTDGEKGEKGEKGDRGDSPYIGSNGHWFVASTDLGVEAKGEKGERGQKGDMGYTGVPGLTPSIGANSNWYLGNVDTGKPSRGEKGEKGDRGNDAVMSEVNGFYHLYINEFGHLIVKYPSDNAVNNFSINEDGHLIFTV